MPRTAEFTNEHVSVVLRAGRTFEELVELTGLKRSPDYTSYVNEGPVDIRLTRISWVEFDGRTTLWLAVEYSPDLHDGAVEWLAGPTFGDVVAWVGARA